MTELNEIISEYMTKRGVKDEHFITPTGWKEIAVLFAKEASREQRAICSESAETDYEIGRTEPFVPEPIVNKESILNAKSPV